MTAACVVQVELPRRAGGASNGNEGDGDEMDIDEDEQTQQDDTQVAAGGRKSREGEERWSSNSPSASVVIGRRPVHCLMTSADRTLVNEKACHVALDPVQTLSIQQVNWRLCMMLTVLTTLHTRKT